MKVRSPLLYASALGGFLGAQDPGDLRFMNLEDLLKVKVVSASKSEETLSNAPATMIVFTKDDFDKRGYTELDQILDDLPGMDVVRSYGSDYFRNYWRGFRSDISDPFLVMIDGMDFNHLWYGNTGAPMVTFPLSAIDRVEVVYGPASSVYGSNAFMGVINVITRKPTVDGFSANGNLTAGSFNTKIADIHAAERIGDLVFSISVRSDKGDIDKSSADKFLYTSSAIYGNKTLWGANAIADSEGKATSPHQNTAVDVRISYGHTEFGYQQLILSTGYGLAYAADQSQMNGLWIINEYNLFLRHTEDFGSRVTGTTLVRYRRSGLDPTSWDLESSYCWGAANGQTFYSRWGNLSSCMSLSQDFEIKASDSLRFNAGVKFDDVTLQKNYDDPGQDGNWINHFPPQPDPTISDVNHFTTENRGAYGQMKWKIKEGNQLTVGIRSDNNNRYGTANTVRGGYVGTFGSWGFKALYGQAYNAPSGRYLFGGIGSTASNPDLHPERSNTAEMSGSYTVKTFSASLDLYEVNNSSKIVAKQGVAYNLGSQEVKGADLGAQWIVPVPSVCQWKIWAYYSHYFSADDIQVVGGVDLKIPSPDLAPNKFKLGTTLVINHNLDMTLLARYVSDRETVASNPVRKVDNHTTMDFNVNWKNFLVNGLCVALRVANLTDKFYYDPGMRAANAGIDPAGFTGNVWHGSAGYYNSLMPQPGRSVEFSVKFNF